MNLAPYIDHTLLKPEVTFSDIQKLCEEAKRFQFHAICINPYWISSAAPILQGTEIKICTVVGFPLGASLPTSKAAATKHSIEQGADEIDMVMNIGAAIEGHWNFVEHEIHEVVSIAALQGMNKTVKVILETCLLSLEQIARACETAKRAGAHFVKTSTGFNKHGATLEHVKLMRKTVGADMGVKASGGIKDEKTAWSMIEAGASRIGTSSGPAIISL